MKRPIKGGCYVRDAKTGNLKPVPKREALASEEAKTETKADAGSKASSEATGKKGA